MSRIKPFEGYNATTSISFREKLPANQAYVAKIINSKMESGRYGDSIVLQLEIAEGDYAGFYKRDFEAQKSGKFEPKYKGVYRINVPSGDGAKWVIDRFNGALGAIELSNDGYHWDWDTDSLKGKCIGIITRECEFNGFKYTDIGMLIAADNARNGKFKPMKPRITGDAPAPTQTSAWAQESEEELPF